MSIFKKLFPFILILILGFFAFKPLLVPGFFPMHDNTQVARVYEMSKGLTDGMFPVRWSKDLGFGYGYPIFNFYAPLAYYIGGFINTLGINALDSTKIMMLLGVIFAGFSMYLMSREFFGKFGALFSSLLYLYAPYHAVEIYVRGDVAEFFAYGLIPLIFYGVYKIYKEKGLKWVVFTSVSYALLIISHNLTAFMVTPFLVVFTIFLLYKNPKKILAISMSFILGILLSAFYWVPAIFEMNYTNVLSQIGGGADYKDHFVCFYQLWSSSWGFGGSAKGCIDGISFMAGKLEIGSFILALLLIFLVFLRKKFVKEDKELLQIISIFAVFLIISVFLILEVSRPVWQAVGPMAIFQYPWRFLIITELSLSLVGGAIIWSLYKFLDERKIILAAIFLLISTIFLNSKFFLPQTYFKSVSSNYTNKESLEWTTSKISSEYMPKNFAKPKVQSEVANFAALNSRDINVFTINQKTQETRVFMGAARTNEIIFPIAYFPAWKVYIDGESASTHENTKGISVSIPSGIHNVLFRFEQTNIEMFSNFISLSSLTALIAVIIYRRKRDE